jgi:hypothetical protein
MAVIANVALTNTFDTWRTRTNVGFTRLNAFAINESSLYANTLTANVTFTSKGLGTFQGRATVGTNLNVSGNTTLGAANKTVNATGWFGVTGRATVSTNLFVSGNTSVTGLKANNSLGSAGQFLRSTGSIAYWDALPPSTQYLQVTNANATFATKVNLNVTGTTTDNSDALSQTLSDASTIAWNIASGRVATVTIGASRTMGAPTNLKVGTYILNVIQGGSGNYNLTWNAAFKWTAGVAPTLSTAVGARDIFSFFSDGTSLYGSFLPDVR